MPRSTPYLAIFIASLPAVTSSSRFQFWYPIVAPWTKALHRSTPNNKLKRKPWAICYGGASNITDVTSDITSNSAVEDDDSLIFQASKPGDGSESDPDGIPDRFLRMQKGNRQKAAFAFEETVKWREENGVNDILSRPHTKFDICREIFPAYIPGRDVHGNIIIVQRPGLFDVDKMKKNNVTTNDVLLHYIYVVEYCWHILDPEPDRTMTVILDLDGLSILALRNSERRNFGRTFVKAMSDNYPQRSFKTLVISAPSWFETAYKIVKPLLRDSTKKKITIAKKGPKQDAALIEMLGIESVPREILHDPSCIEDRAVGDSEPGANSSIEKELRLFCMERIKKFEEVMQSSV